MEKALNIRDFEDIAKQRLPKAAYDYYRSGANAGVSLKDNEEAFTKYHLKPKAFVDPSKFKGIKTKVLGKEVNSPIFIASTAF